AGQPDTEGAELKLDINAQPSYEMVQEVLRAFNKTASQQRAALEQKATGAALPAPAATPPPPPGPAESGTSFLDFDALEQMESKEVAEPKVEKIPETSMASGPVAGPSPGASIVNNKDQRDLQKRGSGCRWRKSWRTNKSATSPSCERRDAHRVGAGAGGNPGAPRNAERAAAALRAAKRHDAAAEGELGEGPGPKGGGFAAGAAGGAHRQHLQAV
ncbi:unnamed protein product, partial [Effrenium voratum]